MQWQYFIVAPDGFSGIHWDYADHPLREPGEYLDLRKDDGASCRVVIIKREHMTLHVRRFDAYDGFCWLWRDIYAHWETYGQPPHYRKAGEWMASGGFMGAAIRNGLRGVQ